MLAKTKHLVAAFKVTAFCVLQQARHDAVFVEKDREGNSQPKSSSGPE
jgi:hypothetical protein